ncbi:MAG: polysaccharide deacetylase 2 family uncharacterized protein YibQ [Gammaproteobacteria bacterium]
MGQQISRTALVLAALLLSTARVVVGADAQGTTTLLPPQPPTITAAVVSIVIDDLGDRRAEGLRAIELPGSVTYAILPHTAHGATLARLAHSLDKEIIVHVPMEAVSDRALGPGGLTAALSQQQFKQRLLSAIASVPHAQGVSNHMGSRLTAMPRQMQWLMDILRMRHDWMFLDSRTTSNTVALSIARGAGLRATFRDVFLDNEVNVSAIRARFREFIAKARMHGSAVAIGHPYAETLQVLAEELPRLSVHRASHTSGRPNAIHAAVRARAKRTRQNNPALEIELVPLSRLIAARASVLNPGQARRRPTNKHLPRQAASSITVHPQPSWVENHPDHR